LSQWLRDYCYLLILVVSGTLLGARATYRTTRGRERIDGWLLAVPVLGDVIRKVGIVRFAHNMAALLGAGITAVDSLSITAETLGNKSMETAVLHARDRLKEGETLARPLAVSQVFPPMVCHMIAVGENTGALDKVLRSVASFYEEEVDRAIEQLNALMEPAIMVILGIVLGAIVVSMYLPIFQMGNLVG
jgi:type IV pilus assembly protein PilC